MPAVPRRPSCSSRSCTRRSCRRRRWRGSGCSRGCATAAACGSASSPARPGSGSRRCSPPGASASRAARPVAWVTLDEGDNDAVVLWAHVIEALGRACPGLARQALVAMVAAAPVREVVLPRLVNGLAEQPEIVLVLDDFHRLSGASARETVAWFVDHLPASVQLVVATRSDPALPLGALRAHGQLLELRADELRFTVAEAGEFLNGRLGLELAAGDVALLTARTEGWPAGIYLAALSLAGSGGPPRARARVRRHERARRRLPLERGARRLRAGPAGVHAAHVGARAPVRAAVRRGARRARVGRRAGVARALEPVPRAAGRPAPLVSLPPPVRADPAPRARAARAGPGGGAAPAGVRVARRVGHHRRGDPPRAWRRARSPRRGS